MDGHQKAEQQEDRGVPGQRLGEHQRLDQARGRRDRLSRDDDLSQKNTWGLHQQGLDQTPMQKVAVSNQA